VCVWVCVDAFIASRLSKKEEKKTEDLCPHQTINQTDAIGTIA